MSRPKTFLALFISLYSLAAYAQPAPSAPPAPSAQPAALNSREQFLKLLDRPRIELNPEEKDLESPAGMKLTRIAFDSEPGQRVPALVLKPADAKPGQRLPVVIALHGTGSKKESNLGLLKKLTAKGFIAISPDGRYHGERCAKGTGTEEYFAQIAKAFEDGKSHPWLFDTSWDVMRLVDYLQTRPDVDPARIGLIGFSKGGMETYLTAAADVRIAVAIPCIGVQSFKWGLENDAWKGRVGTVKGAFEAAMKQANIPKADAAFAKRFYDRVIPGIDAQFDGPAMLPLIAPRPLMVINGDIDDKTPVTGVKLAAESARKAYEAANVGDRFILTIQENTAHQVRPERLTEAVEFFVKWLKPQ